MKNTFAIRCQKCGYEKDFYLGVGLLHSGAPDFDSEYAVLPRLVRDPEALARIKRLVAEEGGTLVTDYCYGVYRCPACGAFYKRFAYAVEKADGQKIMPEYICECGETLEAVEPETLDLSDCVCPECGEKRLHEADSTFSPLDRED
ncbi:hypothetical protein DW091_14880 [Eubacterium sp. AM05-23]|uniref:hypothetical protein n=1 Tax=Eubacterium TaxID=1730 RepID=UPI000E4D0EB0|nr:MULTISPECIES: hypothetical protein [Eubacterium]RHO55923.1 hypothetical protein DW091_14880 [Eubacterium sp. AM05-23]